MSFCEALTITFIVLKLCHVIAWSWWLVLLPLFIQIAILFVFRGPDISPSENK
ncbi:hypothetical protein EDX97_01625 [Absicoccus porci]|uniref:Transmembrane Fragile-X-F protein n=1 Tax=Absicoccus porci TaxID=2486576 RepID=A0A3N0I4A1_9FIRM|nr:hypothetical protein EDX97_01625 [Absicoccus porci]